MTVLMNRRTGALSPDVEIGSVDPDALWIPVEEAEPYFEQLVVSRASPSDRTGDGRFDTSHLSPERAYRIGRDYVAHAIRYGFPLKVIRENYGPGVRILEMGCGRELPMFRTITMDLSCVKFYKPGLYVGADLEPIKYRPQVSGIETVLLEKTNIVDDKSKVDERHHFDLVVSFEVLEHMGKDDGLRFLDAAFEFARRKPVEQDEGGSVPRILLSTPVNGGKIAKNHIYEWQRGELRRAFEQRGGIVEQEYGTFANISDIAHALSPEMLVAWNVMSKFHSPNLLSAMFASAYPEVARNITWLVRVR